MVLDESPLSTSFQIPGSNVIVTFGGAVKGQYCYLYGIDVGSVALEVLAHSYAKFQFYISEF